MSFFHWCMRYGAAILFVIAGLQLAIGIIIVLKTVGAASGNPGFAGLDGGSPLQGLVILDQLIRVLTTAALPFFGALVINRLDKKGDPREAEPFE
jgi:hypothetical protein